MKNTKGHRFYCAICQDICDSLHELVPGRGNRKVCIEYNIQLPLCVVCNSVQMVHGQHSKEWRNKLFEILGIDEYKAVQAIHNKNKREYLEKVKEKCEKRILSFLV